MLAENRTFTAIARNDAPAGTGSSKPRACKNGSRHSDAPAQGSTPGAERHCVDFAAQVGKVIAPDGNPAAAKDPEARPTADPEAVEGEFPDPNELAQPDGTLVPGTGEDVPEQPVSDAASGQAEGTPVPRPSSAVGAHGHGAPGLAMSEPPSVEGRRGGDDPGHAKRRGTPTIEAARSHPEPASGHPVNAPAPNAHIAGNVAQRVDGPFVAALGDGGDGTARSAPASGTPAQPWTAVSTAAGADPKQAALRSQHAGLPLSPATEDQAGAPDTGGRDSPPRARVSGTGAPPPALAPGDQRSPAGSMVDPANGLLNPSDASPPRDITDPPGLGAVSDPAGPSVAGRGAEVALGRVEPGRMAAAQIASAVADARSRPVEIALHPEELGRVRIALSATETGMAVSISAERPETLDLMRRHIDQLAQEFRRLGYSDIGFDFGQGDAGWTLAGRRQGHPPAESEPAASPATAAVPVPNGAQGGASAMPAGSAALDLRL